MQPKDPLQRQPGTGSAGRSLYRRTR